MRIICTLLIAIMLLTGCENNSNSKCECCEIPYNSLTNALKCIEENPKQSSHDNRLFLLAFTDSYVKDWNIIGDSEIISIAKNNYLLVTLSETESNFLSKNGTPELLDVIEKNRNENMFFVITNQALYPFAEWNNKEKKEVIIERLGIGNGP